mmetsp:Transcript_110983/g.220738  ORF Transcript_110983/g.220738 Transcript_110983/m.220738 type:complete len:146 (+) Transcript_110983:63-500(+)
MDSTMLRNMRQCFCKESSLAQNLVTAMCIAHEQMDAASTQAAVCPCPLNFRSFFEIPTFLPVEALKYPYTSCAAWLSIELLKMIYEQRSAVVFRPPCSGPVALFRHQAKSVQLQGRLMHEQPIGAVLLCSRVIWHSNSTTHLTCQ